MTNEEVIKFITKQGTLEPPSGCPQKITGYIPMVSALDHVIHTGDKINDKAGHRLQGADQLTFSNLLAATQELPCIHPKGCHT